jgi:hypothetical protein
MQKQWRSACHTNSMDERSAAHEFLGRLDTGELDGKLFEEMNKLSYEQLLHVGGWLAERHLARAKGKRAELAPWLREARDHLDRH